MTSSRRLLVSAAALWILGPLVYVGAEAVAASAFPGYSYAGNYISDLGVPEAGDVDGRAIDSPLHAVMNAGFVAEGVLFLAAALLTDQVLRALAHALDLDEHERAHLFRLARPLPPPGDRAPSITAPSMEALLEHWPMTPAFAFDRNLDVLGTNDLLRRIAPEKGVPGANLLLSVAEGYVHAREDGIPADQLEVWDSIFRELIAALRFYSDPDDPRLQEIVGECSVRYRQFRSVWAEYEVHPITQRALRIDVAPFGWLDFDMQTFESAVAPGHFVVTYLARAGTPAAAAIDHFAALRPAARQAVADIMANAEPAAPRR